MAEGTISTRWSILASVVDAQLNVELDRDDILALLRILHDYEAYEHYLIRVQSAIGPTHDVSDDLFAYFEGMFGTDWPAYTPPSRDLVRSSEVDEKLMELDEE